MRRFSFLRRNPGGLDHPAPPGYRERNVGSADRGRGDVNMIAGRRRGEGGREGSKGGRWITRRRFPGKEERGSSLTCDRERDKEGSSSCDRDTKGY